MKCNFFLVIVFCNIILWLACKSDQRNADKKYPQKPSGEAITDPIVQDTLFKRLERLTHNTIPTDKLKDSLAFLLLPVRASCPSCRRKTIDSIVKYQHKLDSNHFVIIIGNGRKSISGYFEQQNKKLPISERIYYDTLELGSLTYMSSKNPNIYYSFNGRVYRKISCLPNTIKKDLREFYRNL